MVSLGANLHGNKPVVHEYLLREEIRADRRLVAGAELLIDLIAILVRGSSCSRSSYVLIHQACLPDPTIPQYNYLLEAISFQ